MKTPEQIAADIVDRFSWGSNVVYRGRLVGQQFVVAIAIADAIRAERVRGDTARDALVDTTLALNGVSTGYLKPKGRHAKSALATAAQAMEMTR
jgi:hypothetical protein